jgi:hypothetical protein
MNENNKPKNEMTLTEAMQFAFNAGADEIVLREKHEEDSAPDLSFIAFKYNENNISSGKRDIPEITEDGKIAFILKKEAFELSKSFGVFDDYDQMSKGRSIKTSIQICD